MRAVACSSFRVGLSSMDQVSINANSKRRDPSSFYGRNCVIHYINNKSNKEPAQAILTFQN